MVIDLFDLAKKLHVVDVWQGGNETGWLTPRVLFDSMLKAPDGEVKAPTLSTFRFWIDHGTAGVNTLRFWGEGGSVANDTWSLAHYLNPRDTTVYKDGLTHDTRYTVFKMVEPGYACNNVGPSIPPISNRNTLSMEYESLQNGTHDITDLQYAKGALVTAHDLAERRIPDWFRLPHGIVAIPWGRRTDPWAGKFDIARAWEIIRDIRSDARIWQMWGLQQP